MIIDSDQLIDAMEQFEVLHKLVLRDLVLLAILSAAERPMSGDSLATWIGVHPNTARQRMTRMAELGLVKKDYAERRHRFGNELAVTITPAGRTILKSFAK